MSPRAGCLRRWMPITFLPCPLVLHAPGCACGLEANKSTATGGCYRTRGKGGPGATVERPLSSDGVEAARGPEMRRWDTDRRAVVRSNRCWLVVPVGRGVFACACAVWLSVCRSRCDQAQVWHPSPAPPPLYIKAPLFQTRVRQVQNCPPTMENVLNKSTSLFMTDELGQLCPEISE